MKDKKRQFKERKRKRQLLSQVKKVSLDALVNDDYGMMKIIKDYASGNGLMKIHYPKRKMK